MISHNKFIRASKDAEYGRSLSVEESNLGPAHPAGLTSTLLKRKSSSKEEKKETAGNRRNTMPKAFVCSTSSTKVLSTRQHSWNGAAVPVCLVISASLIAYGQAPAPAALTDAQAVQLLQALTKGQANGSAALSAVQLQMLAQYLQRESQSAPASSAINLTQAQLAAQMLAAQSQISVASATGQSGGQIATAATPPAATVLVASNLPPKKPGIMRIGVVQPKQVAQGTSPVNVSETLRATIIQYLSGPTVEVTPITAMLPSQIDAELKQKECDYVLYSSLSQKMNSGGFGMLKKAMPVASMIPMVGALGGMAGAVAASAGGVAMTGAAGIASTVKAKSEVTFDYKLVTAGRETAVLANSTKAKAKEDGEDIITPLIEQAASAILGEVTKKK
jgi:hypothetical protein